MHVAAAGYRVEIAKMLLAAGAEVGSAKNRRSSQPLHYASDGHLESPAWNAERQVEMIRLLLEAGADIDAQDKNGATPLHRVAESTRRDSASAQEGRSVRTRRSRRLLDRKHQGACPGGVSRSAAKSPGAARVEVCAQDASSSPCDRDPARRARRAHPDRRPFPLAGLWSPGTTSS